MAVKIAATSGNANLQTLYSQIFALEERLESLKSEIFDYDMEASNSAFPFNKRILLLALLSYVLFNIFKPPVVPCSSYHVPMVVLLISVYAVIFIKTIVSALIRIFTARNHANVIRGQIIDLKPHATLLQRELELSVETNYATSMIPLHMEHITSMIDDPGYDTLTGSFRIDTLIAIFMMIFYTSYFGVMVMPLIYDAADLCSSFAPTI